MDVSIWFPHWELHHIGADVARVASVIKQHDYHSIIIRVPLVVLPLGEHRI